MELLTDAEFQELLKQDYSAWKKQINRTRVYQAETIFSKILAEFDTIKESEALPFLDLILQIRTKLSSELFTQYFQKLCSILFADQKIQNSLALDFLRKNTDSSRFSDTEKNILIKNLTKNFLKLPSLSALSELRSNLYLFNLDNADAKEIIPTILNMVARNHTGNHHSQLSEFKKTLEEALHFISSKEDLHSLDTASSLFLNTVPTKTLLAFYKKERVQSFFPVREWERESENSHLSHKASCLELIKKELNSREHVPTKDDKKLISTMSRHAGVKLSLQEAKDLYQKLKGKDV